MKVSILVEFFVELPENKKTLKNEAHVANAVMCGLTNSIEHSEDDGTLIDWLPTNSEITLMKTEIVNS